MVDEIQEGDIDLWGQDDQEVAPVPAVSFSTGTQTGKTPRHVNSSNRSARRWKGVVGRSLSPYGRRHSTNRHEVDGEAASPASLVRFRARSASPPPRPPPAIQRAQTIKARGGATMTSPSNVGGDEDQHSMEDSRTTRSTEDNEPPFMSPEDVPFFTAEEGRKAGMKHHVGLHGYGAVQDSAGFYLQDNFVDNGDEDNEDVKEEAPESRAKELWMKMRDHIKRGSFMVHSFSDHNRSLVDDGDDMLLDDGASAHGSIFSGYEGDAVMGNDDATRRSVVSTDLPYEITLTECGVAILMYLLVGVIAYSYVFENWTVVDSLYFTIVTGTLVGFGDIVPSCHSSKAFTSVFAATSIVFFGLVIGVLGSRLVEYQVNAVENANAEMARKVTGVFRLKNKRGNGQSLSSGLFSRTNSTESLMSLTSNASYTSLESLESLQADQTELSKQDFFRKGVLEEHSRWYSQMFSLLCRYLPALIPIVLASFLFAYLEGWHYVDAFYFFVSTSCAIGYGDVVPQSTPMKFFAIIFIPLAVGAVGHTLGAVTNFIVERRRSVYQRQVWSQELKVGDLHIMDWDRDGEVSKLDYVEFMLLTLKKVDANLINELHQQFDQLDTNRSGSLTKQDLERLAKKRLKRVRHKLKLSSYKYELLHKNQ